MKKLTIDFYNRDNVIEIARELLGKIVTTNFAGEITSGRIVETEAYKAFTDKASHAFGGRRTIRNEHMYAPAATVYIYVCYGLHQMLNIVTNRENIPDAILVRAIEPLEGIDVMLQRTGKKIGDNTLTRGPGNVGKALGIHKIYSGTDLTGETIFLAEDNYRLVEEEVGESHRIGVNYAGEDALLPYRFFIKANPYVSGKPNK